MLNSDGGYINDSSNSHNGFVIISDHSTINILSIIISIISCFVMRVGIFAVSFCE